MAELSEKVKLEVEEAAARAGLTTGVEDMGRLLLLFVLGVIVYKELKK